MIPISTLYQLYFKKSISVRGIAKILDCSQSKVNYWMYKHKINKRSISEAVYLKHNPSGDPFSVTNYKTKEEAVLFGLGLGLYWGEGTKSNLSSVRLGNTDPRLIKKFINFLETFYSIQKKKLRFGLQVFSDMSASKAKNFWIKQLRVNKNQFQKVVVTPARSLGNYRVKNQTGVLTVYYNNKKLRDILCSVLESL